jgi:hypothetical protein
VSPSEEPTRTSQFGGKDLEPWAKVETDEALQADALLLGRKSDEWFASRWQSRTGPWADCLNSLPKLVVSSTLKTATYQGGPRRLSAVLPEQSHA